MPLLFRTSDVKHGLLKYSERKACEVRTGSIIKWSNMKADVAYSKVLTRTNIMAIKSISRGLF
jgi:hypothetical protein